MTTAIDVASCSNHSIASIFHPRMRLWQVTIKVVLEAYDMTQCMKLKQDIKNTNPLFEINKELGILD